MRFDETVCSPKEAENMLQIIYKNSPFKSAFAIQAQFDKIKEHGTYINIYNLKMNELDFQTGI
jgi:hypothetical protein